MSKTMIRCLVVACMLIPASVLADADDVTNEIPMLALSLVGTPYRPGGDDARTGLDCSGLVQLVFREAAHLTLPRDTASLSLIGQAVERSELVTGDLVFFNTQDRPASHVGIYLGEGRFVHASSSSSGSVMLSSLNDPYWAARFDGARRVLAGAATVSDTPHP
jgi:cell wall-associated NlpC family hydrolase